MKLSFLKKIKNVLSPIYYKFKPVFVIPKEDLKHDHYYQGYSTYFTVAKWNAKEEHFIGLQDFKVKKIVHVHDKGKIENVFVPVKQLDRLDVFQREKAFEAFVNQNKNI